MLEGDSTDTSNTSGNEEDADLANDSIENEGESSAEMLVDTSFALNDVTQDLMLLLAGYQAEQLVLLVDELVASAISGLEGESMESVEITLFDTQSDTAVTEPVTRVIYNCAGGGTVVREKGNVTFINADIFRAQRLDGYIFNQCNHDTSGITFPDDNYTINGSLKILESRSTVPGNSSAAFEYIWAAFSLRASNAAAYELEGIVDTSITLSTTGNFSLPTSEMDLYRKTVAEKVVVSIEDGVFKLTRRSIGGGSIQNYAVDIDGTMRLIILNMTGMVHWYCLSIGNLVADHQVL